MVFRFRNENFLNYFFPAITIKFSSLKNTVPKLEQVGTFSIFKKLVSFKTYPKLSFGHNSSKMWHEVDIQTSVKFCPTAIPTILPILLPAARKSQKVSSFQLFLTLFLPVHPTTLYFLQHVCKNAQKIPNITEMLLVFHVFAQHGNGRAVA